MKWKTVYGILFHKEQLIFQRLIVIDTTINTNINTGIWRQAGYIPKVAERCF